MRNIVNKYTTLRNTYQSNIHTLHHNMHHTTLHTTLDTPQHEPHHTPHHTLDTPQHEPHHTPHTTHHHTYNTTLHTTHNTTQHAPHHTQYTTSPAEVQAIVVRAVQLASQSNQLCLVRIATRRFIRLVCGQSVWWCVGSVLCEQKWAVCCLNRIVALLCEQNCGVVV